MSTTNASVPLLKIHTNISYSVCYDPHYSAQPRLNSPSLDNAYMSLAVFCAAAIFLHISLKVWKDEEGHAGAVIRAIPTTTLGFAYTLARWVPDACLSPLAFAHWIIAAVGWILIMRSVCRWADVIERRKNMFTVLDAFCFACYARASHTHEGATSAFLLAVALNGLSLFFVNQLVTESVDGDCGSYSNTRACKRLMHLSVLKLGLSLFLMIGPHGYAWLSSETLVYVTGFAELGAVVSGIREFRMNKGGD